ncbi:MAG: hypothetical protein IKG61_04250, partial [Selenomonadaceae bacterium]|nr:hypothetical protein [Selenomonadaceae bacterium]
MKIVVLDGYTLNPGDLSWEGLETLGECKIYDRTSQTDDAEIISRIGDAEIVFMNKTPLTKKILDACNVKYIGVLATGYNVSDDIYYCDATGSEVWYLPTCDLEPDAGVTFIRKDWLDKLG